MPILTEVLINPQKNKDTRDFTNMEIDKIIHLELNKYENGNFQTNSP